MRVNVNIEALNHGQSLYRLNASTAQIRGDQKLDTGKSDANTDKVTISPMGKAMSMMESLMKQKESINQRKHELIENTLEKGGSLGDIQEQLDSMDESLEMLDEQLSQLTESTLKEQTEEPARDADGAEKAAGSVPKTEEELQAAQVSSNAALAAGLETIKTVSSVKSRMEGRINVLKSEIRQDKATSSPALSKSGRKQSEAASLREKIEDASDLLGKVSGEVSEEVRGQTEQNAAKPEQKLEADGAQKSAEAAEQTAEGGSQASENAEHEKNEAL